jgi:hypothetical protein
MKTLNGWLTHMKDDASWIKHMFTETGKYMSAITYIMENKPKFVVEYGGGQSTWILSELINYLDYGGKVVGYENDEYYYNQHIEKGWNKYNNIKLVDIIESTEFNTRGVRYIHPIEDIKEVDFVIIDGPDLKQFQSDPNTTFNLMDIVNHLGYEIPYFIDGRSGTRDFYGNNTDHPHEFGLDYKTDIGDTKEI